MKTISEKDLKHIISLLKSVRTSCDEGQDGTWDCSTDEGKEGFSAMSEQIDEVIDKLKK